MAKAAKPRPISTDDEKHRLSRSIAGSSSARVPGRAAGAGASIDPIFAAGYHDTGNIDTTKAQQKMTEKRI
jgi:hypothetical protein